MEKEIFKTNLRVYRAQHHLTQEDLAKAVGVTRKTINTIENEVFIPSAYLALKIAKFFNEPFENIFYIEHKSE